MYYSINYDGGYVVTLTRVWEDGILRAKPLRKFRYQGDALAFREFDCYNLTEAQIKTLVKNYDPSVVYKRINNKRFEKFSRYEDRETEEWWWGGKSHPTQHHDKEYNPDDDNIFS